MQKWAHSKGFTIVELLIVVVVIAILAAITIVAFNGIQNRAKVSALQSSTSQASKKIASYAITNSDTLPPDLASLGINDTNNASYSYVYDNTPNPNIYCVSATNGTLSYSFTSKTNTMSDGRCVNNKVLNPSFETNFTSWTLAGSGTPVISRVTTEAYAGSASLQVIANGTSGMQGAFTSSRAPVVPNSTYTASVWIKGEAGKTLRIEFGEWDSAPALTGSRTSSVTLAGNGSWQRYTVTRTMAATAATADIVIRNIAAVAHTFYIDGVMISEGTDQYNFSDGNSTGWAWSGTANNTTSLGPAILYP